MATTLSSPFKWKSNNNRYLRLHGGEIRNQDGILEFTREDSSLIFTKEVSQNYSECMNQIEWFHKHTEANCYLKLEQKEEGWLIVATAHTPNDDKDDENCTLFTPEKPDIVKPNTFRIRHVQNNLYLRPQKLEQYGLDAALCAVSSKPDDTEKWMSLQSLAVDHHNYHMMFMGNISGNPHETSLVPSMSLMGLKGLLHVLNAIEFPAY